MRSVLPYRAVLTAGAVLLSAMAAARAQPAAPPQADACVLELDLPAAATVSIDGRDYGTKRRLSYRSLERDRPVQSRLTVRFPDGATASRGIWLEAGRTVRLAMQSPKAERPQLVLQAGADSLPMAQFTDDGKRLITASGPQATLWDAATGRILRGYGDHANDITFIALADGGQTIASGSYDGAIVFHDLETGRVRRQIKAGSCNRGALSDDGRFVVVAGASYGQGDLPVVAECWDVATSRRVAALVSGKDEYGSSAAISPDARWAAIGTSTGDILLWEPRAGGAFRRLPPLSGVVMHVTFSHDGRLIAASSAKFSETWQVISCELAVWTLDGRQVAKRSQANVFGVPQFSRDDQRVFASVYVPQSPEMPFVGAEYDAATLDERRRFGRGALQAVSRDEQQALTGNTVVDMAGGQERRVLSIATDAIKHICYSSDGRYLLAAGYHAQWLLDAATFECVQTMTVTEQESLCESHFVDGDRRIVTLVFNLVQHDYDIVQFDAATGREMRRHHVGNEFKITVSDDGRLALTEGVDSCTVWDLNLGQPLHDFGDDVFVSAISPDGGLAFTSTNEQAPDDSIDLDRVGVLWDVPSFKRRTAVDVPYAWPTDAGGDGSLNVYSSLDEGAAISRDGRTIALLGAKQSGDKKTAAIGFWDVAGQKLTKLVTGSSDEIDGGEFSVDGRYLVTVAEPDHRVAVWHVASGQALFETDAHRSPCYVSRPVLSADSRTLAVLPGDGSIQFWDVATGQELLRYIRLKSGGWLAVTPEGLFDGSADGRELVAFRIGEALNVVPVDRFFQDFYHPGLVPDVFAAGGGKLLPEIEIARSKPPVVRIVAPTSGAWLDRRASLEVALTDEGGGVAGPYLYQNGARMLAQGATRREGGVVYRTFDVSLIEGDNHFRVTATTADGSWESEPAEIVLRYERPLEKSELYIVAIGVNDYADANLRLNYAANDARQIASLFEDRGGSLYAGVHTTLLIDRQADRASIREACRQAAAATRAQDTLVFFLAGHGAMVGQRYYFVPQEFGRQSDRIDDDLRTQGLPADEIGEALGAAHALKRILILDTCASGGALSVAATGRSGFALRGAVERLARSQGIFTIAASAAVQEAQESQELGHGILSYALLAGLKAVDQGPLAERAIQPSSPERVVDVLEWFSYASGNVPRLTERLFGAFQEVQMSTHGQSFPVLPLD